ncbi:MAG: lipopolysaccharide biosynthesis protein [Candidatus Hydrogenedentota bacterium]|nr:MAG: lipopolysaccharide biosynthesis protein [Candidatus Hydrogenedentota bacterium]
MNSDFVPKWLKKVRTPGTFLNNVVSLTTGTGLAQGLTLLLAPLLTRLFSPEDFGSFAIYLAAVSLLGALAAARYELAIMLPEKDEEALNLVALCFFLAAGGLILLTMLSVLAVKGKWLGEWSCEWIYWIPFAVFLTALREILGNWCARKQEFRFLATMRLGQTNVVLAISVAAGLAGADGKGLIAGHITGLLFVCAGLFLFFLRTAGALRGAVTRSEMRRLAAVHKDFPLVNSVHTLVDMLQSSGVPFVIGGFFGGTILGFYSIAQRVLTAPLGVVGNAVSQVYYEKAARGRRKGEKLYSSTLSLLKGLSLLYFPFLAAGLAGGPDLFAFVFGAGWGEAGKLARILAPFVWLRFLVSPLSRLPLVMEEQRRAFLFGIFYNIAVILPLILAGIFGQKISEGLFCSVVVSSTVLLFYLRWLLKLAAVTEDGNV